MDSLTTVSTAAVLASLKRLRIMNVVSREYSLQLMIAERLAKDGIPHTREVKLGPGNVVDFLLPGGVAIEVKKGKPPSTPKIMAQVERYAAFPAVTTIIVACERKVHAADGVSENGKPVHVLNLVKNWGVAI